MRNIVLVEKIVKLKTLWTEQTFEEKVKNIFAMTNAIAYYYYYCY